MAPLTNSKSGSDPAMKIVGEGRTVRNLSALRFLRIAEGVSIGRLVFYWTQIHSETPLRSCFVKVSNATPLLSLPL